MGSKPGPKPKPSGIHKLEGGRKKTHRKKKDAGSEPNPEKYKRVPWAPKHLDKIASNEWRRMAKIYFPTGIMTKMDKTGLELYCAAYSVWRGASDKIIKHGTVIKAQSGFPVQSPYLQIVNKQQAIMQKWLAEFGGTPSSRSRVTIEKPKGPSDLEKFMAKGKKLERVK